MPPVGYVGVGRGVQVGAEHHELFERTKEAWNKAVPWARAHRLE